MDAELNAWQQTTIELAETFVKEQLAGDSSGHDWWHIHRVRNLAVRIAKAEGADLFVCEMAALLHDVADEKLNPSFAEGLAKVEHWLSDHVASEALIRHVMTIIATLSYGGGHNPPMETLEGRVVQDADRLDAIGAIGIARTFAFGGTRGRSMHDPTVVAQDHLTKEAYRQAEGTTINHFYEKLLRLKNGMNTETGRALATSRHAYMEGFLKQFYAEWDATDDY